MWNYLCGIWVVGSSVANGALWGHSGVLAFWGWVATSNTSALGSKEASAIAQSACGWVLVALLVGYYWVASWAILLVLHSSILHCTLLVYSTLWNSAFPALWIWIFCFSCILRYSACLALCILHCEMFCLSCLPGISFLQLFLLLHAHPFFSLPAREITYLAPILKKSGYKQISFSNFHPLSVPLGWKSSRTKTQNGKSGCGEAGNAFFCLAVAAACLDGSSSFELWRPTTQPPFCSHTFNIFFRS